MGEGYQISANHSSPIVIDGFSNGSHPTPPLLLKQSTPMVVVFCVAYILVCILAVVNNSLVVSVICRNPQMRTITNYFLANLAVADIMVSVLVLPITLLSNLFSDNVKYTFYFLANLAVADIMVSVHMVIYKYYDA